MSFRDYVESGPSLLTDVANKIMGTFVLENTTSAIANTLVRAIHVNTRSAGFEADLSADSKIKIRTCTANLYSDMLMQRLTMLPLGVRDLDTFIPENYECVLRVKNETPVVRHVRASDFVVREKQPDGAFETLGAEATRALFPPDPVTGETSLLVSLMPQRAGKAPEEVDLTAIPVVSTGKKNIGFSPVCQPSFGNTLDMDPVRRAEFFSTWLAENKKMSDVRILTPESLAAFRLEVPGATEAEFITWLAAKPIRDQSVLVPDALAAFNREWLTMAVQRCFMIDPATGEANSFTFKVESVGIRPVPDIVAEAIRAIIQLVRPFADEAVPMADVGMHVRPIDSRMFGIDVFIANQEHTLGNLLQTLIAAYIAESPEGQIATVGYKVPHPLEAMLQVRLGVAPGYKGDLTALARKTIAAACVRAIAIFESLGQSWATLTAGVVSTVVTRREPKHQVFSDESVEE